MAKRGYFWQWTLLLLMAQVEIGFVIVVMSNPSVSPRKQVSDVVKGVSNKTSKIFTNSSSIKLDEDETQKEDNEEDSEAIKMLLDAGIGDIVESEDLSDLRSQVIEGEQNLNINKVDINQDDASSLLHSEFGIFDNINGSSSWLNLNFIDETISAEESAHRLTRNGKPIRICFRSKISVKRVEKILQDFDTTNLSQSANIFQQPDKQLQKQRNLSTCYDILELIHNENNGTFRLASGNKDGNFEFSRLQDLSELAKDINLNSISKELNEIAIKQEYLNEQLLLLSNGQNTERNESRKNIISQLSSLAKTLTHSLENFVGNESYCIGNPDNEYTFNWACYLISDVFPSVLTPPPSSV